MSRNNVSRHNVPLHSQWIHRHAIRPCGCHKPRCQVPPSPELLARLLERYNELKSEGRVPRSLTFKQFFDVWASKRRGPGYAGLDDGDTAHGPRPRVMQISRPPKQLRGVVRTLVLLVDFPDCPHAPTNTRAHYQRMLFGLDGTFPTGSMREYYRRISNFGENAGIDVDGEVHGWFRMPQPLSFYANNESGMSEASPRNARGLAHDAVMAAIEAGVDFNGYDVFKEKIVTALFVIHAGSGAEETGEPGDIWSHKWLLPKPVIVAPGIKASTYLTVPEDCKVGVCAHEWGHLAARWADYYDTGEEENTRSNGLGDYCLMASGSWGNHGTTPALPNGMLRMFHKWIAARVVQKSTNGLLLKPAAEGGDCIVIQNKKTMKATQYILVEYRRRRAQDAFLPDEGIAVYVVDEKIDDVNDEDALAIELIQADGKRDLALIFGSGNNGDSGDLYPFQGRDRIDKTSQPPLNMPSGKFSGVSIVVKGSPGQDTMSIDVAFAK